MSCCQCQGVEEAFNEKFASDQLSRYRKKGPDRTTRMLVDAIKKEGIQGFSLLDIGGGVGAVQHGLLDADLQSAIDVDASQAYIRAASTEAQRLGFAERACFQYGNFVDVADQIPPADVVTLDRVICCYPDMEKLVGLSAAHARKLYGLVYPRDVWWIKIAIALANFFFRLRRSSFRIFIHSTQAVEALVNSKGLKRHFHRTTLFWQVFVYSS